MNDAILQRLALEIANQAAINQWKFYTALLVLSFIGSALGSFLSAYFKKRGEVSATKADAAEILQQLRETTRAAKSVELSLSQGDWIQREKNSLKRSKLEELVSTGFAIGEWLSSETSLSVANAENLTAAPIFQFEMLATLYFPELKEHSEEVKKAYYIGYAYCKEIRIEIAANSLALEAANKINNTEEAERLVNERFNHLENHMQYIVKCSTAVYIRMQELAQAAHHLMEKLTNHPSDTP